MSTTTRRITVQEFRDITVEGDRRQLIAGEVVVNDPTWRQQEIFVRLILALRACGCSTASPAVC